jgi:cytochrome o ubiquinol oxidase subunit 3
MTVQARLAPAAAIDFVTEAAEEEVHDTASITTLGFWIYLMSDCILFAALFATFAVMRGQTNGGPTGRQIFDLPYVAVETSLLLASSFTYGLAMIEVQRRRQSAVLAWLGITLLLGLGFVGMEIHEFAKLVAEGNGPDRSGFLSAFFTLVATHGLHVTSGIVWMLVMITHIKRRGLTEVNQTRLACLSMFWHFLDVVWIGVFTIVYLMGVA